MWQALDPMDRSEDSIRNWREAVVREHMASENELRFEDTMLTFSHPRYEIVPTGEVFDGAESVAAYYRSSREAVPDQRNELLTLHHYDQGVLVEFVLMGTAAWGTSKGREFECQMVALFDFDEAGIVCERVYFDRRTIRDQLTGSG